MIYINNNKININNFMNDDDVLLFFNKKIIIK